MSSITTAPRHAFVEFQDHKGEWSRYAAVESDNTGLTRQLQRGGLTTLERPSQSTALTNTDLLAHWGLAGDAQVFAELSSHQVLVARSALNPPQVPIGPGADVFMHPISQQMLEDLSALVINNTGTSSLMIYSNGLGNDTPTLVRAIAYSYSNGMGMSRTTDHGTVFQLLKQSESLRQGLQSLLQAVHPSFGMCLADNLFRHAVEAGNAQAVRMVLQMARSRFAYTIDPNRIKCALPKRGKQYTPLETAASQRHLELVQMLLNIGADPNHSYWKGYSHFQGALEAALWDFTDAKTPNERQPVDKAMVQLLLNHCARVRPETLRLLLGYPLIEMELVRDVIEHIQVKDHPQYFPDPGREEVDLRPTSDPLYAYVEMLMPDIARIFQNSAAVSATKTFFSKCSAENCGLCTSRHQKEMAVLLHLAAWRGNSKLVEFILPMVPYAPLQTILVAAIRSRDNGLINYLLEIGATVDRPASSMSTVFGGFVQDMKLPFLEAFTPLSEAIHCQDEHLISRLESLGALSKIGGGKGGRFIAAATAAAFTANIRYLRKLCGTASEMNGKYLSSALTAAIARNHYDIVCFLLFHTQVMIKPEHLEAVIYVRNKTMFNLLIDYIPSTAYSLDRNGALYAGMLTYASTWGDVEVLDWLKQLGVSSNQRAITHEGLYQTPSANGLSPLLFDILVGDISALKWALAQGADPCFVPPYYSTSPLALAALCADVEMVRLLLAHKANVSDTLAFVFALEYSRDIFETLLMAFAAQFPDGIPGFGRMVLVRAVREGKDREFNQLLQSKMDVTTTAERDLVDGVYGIAYNCRKTYTDDERGRNTFGSGRGDFIKDRMDKEAETLKQLIGMSALGYAIRESRGNSGYCMVRSLLEAGGDPNSYARTDPLATPLLLAIEYGDIELMGLLLEWGADANRPALQGILYTPLQLSSKLGRLDMVEFLLQRGADARAAPSLVSGGTALQVTAQSGNIKIAQLLLDNGANVHESPSKVRGRTAFEGAAEEGRITMLEFLWTQACPAGFPPDELERARAFADQEGHRGCVEYIDLLLMIVGDARTPRLSAG
ncbi:hypothetical protein PG985_003464 [Apiospora marii]|uniref:uncharacterized protein n=1 Tax=Apiospora marii TaxID=335849 RepID=UPI0031314542